MRWEWRCFLPPSLIVSTTGNSYRSNTFTDLYFMPTPPHIGIKQRDGALELKTRSEREADGLELWHKTRLPRSSSLVDVASHLEHNKEDLLRIPATKSRQQWYMGGRVLAENTLCSFALPDSSPVNILSVSFSGSHQNTLRTAAEFVARLPEQTPIMVCGYPEFIAHLLYLWGSRRPCPTHSSHSTTKYCSNVECYGLLQEKSCQWCSHPLCDQCHARCHAAFFPSAPDALTVAESELRVLGDNIRQMKRDGADRSTIEAKVAALKQRKEAHAEIIGAAIAQLQGGEIGATSSRIEELANLLPPDAKGKLSLMQRQTAKLKKSEKQAKFDTRLFTEGLLCQRKIHSLMAHEGEGPTFRYYPRINPGVGFIEGQSVYLTEKMDGTTVQATNKGVFKRLDLGKKGTAKWHSTPEAARYRVDRLDLSNPKNRHIATAVEPYLATFAALPGDLCVYFEALSHNIGKRFQHMEGWNGIRVFDVSKNGEFLPFAATLELCRTTGLPVVAHRETVLNLRKIMQSLQTDQEYTDLKAQLEGYVVRHMSENSEAAKIRADDMPKVVHSENGSKS